MICCLLFSMASSSKKRKWKMLKIDENFEIVSLLDKNHSLAAVASKYENHKVSISQCAKLSTGGELTQTLLFSV